MYNKDIKNPAKTINVTVFLRDVSNFSVNDADIGSTNDIAEVIPAENKHKKNIGPIIYPTEPIVLNTLGNATNANPVPYVTTLLSGIPVEKLIYPNIPNTPIAENTSNPLFVNAIIRPFSTRSVSSGK